jgi:hypothetical protein
VSFYPQLVLFQQSNCIDWIHFCYLLSLTGIKDNFFWCPCHMLPVELWEPSCKSSSLPVDRKYQKGRPRDNKHYYTLHICLLYKSNKTIWMFYRKCDDEGNNPVDNPNIYNVEGDYRLSPSLQPLTTGSVLKIRFFLIRFRNFFFYTRNYFVVFC